MTIDALIRLLEWGVVIGTIAIYFFFGGSPP